jgi:hypothetical protein
MLVAIYQNRQGLYRKFKNLSPFKDKTLIHIDYGIGFARINIFELGEREFTDKLRQEDFMVYDADKYLMTIPFRKDLLKDAEILHIGSGYLPQNQTRDSEGNPRNNK